MNKHKAIMELQDRAKMHESVLMALGILEQWEFNSEDVTEATKLLKKESEKLSGEIEDLMDAAAEGKLNLEKAFE